MRHKRPDTVLTFLKFIHLKLLENNPGDTKMILWYTIPLLAQLPYFHQCQHQLQKGIFSIP